MKHAVLLSGGADSATLLYYVLQELAVPGDKTCALIFHYHQRHAKEVGVARKLCAAQNIEAVDVITLGSLLVSLGRSPLTNLNLNVPDAAANKQATTVVPFRNTFFLITAAAYAAVNQYDVLYIGATREDLVAYEDCRPEYFEQAQRLIRLADREATHIKISAPFNLMYKKDVVKLGLALKVPYEDTWSCYQGGQFACGKCDACVERIASFKANNEADPMQYVPPIHWEL